MSKKMLWEKPQLIVLARGTPEEAVLTHCKAIDQSGAPGTTILPNGSVQIACNRTDGGQYDAGNNCGACQARSGS